MRNFLFASAAAAALTVSTSMAFANPAHHTGDTAPAQGAMMSEGMMSGNMMGKGMMSGGMMGSGMMMHPDMMIVMLDTDGDGSLSLEEFQSMHERMFTYMDKNKDGKLEASELANHHGDGMPMSSDAN